MIVMEKFVAECEDAVVKALAAMGAPSDLRLVKEFPETADLAIPCFTFAKPLKMAPVAIAEKTFTTRTFIESTRETAEIAAAPAVVTMTVSAVPMRELSSCSIIRGTIRAHVCFLEKIGFEFMI